LRAFRRGKPEDGGREKARRFKKEKEGWKRSASRSETEQRFVSQKKELYRGERKEGGLGQGGVYDPNDDSRGVAQSVIKWGGQVQGGPEE